MEETIDLQEIYQIIKKRLTLISLLAVFAAVASGVFTYSFITPLYRSSTQLVVSRLSNEINITSAEVSGSVQLINTFNVIIVSPTILDQVIEELDLEASAGSLRNRMAVRNERNAQIMTLVVYHEDPITASDIANKTAEVFEREVPGIMNVDESLVSILAQAHPTRSPVSPRPMMNMGLAFVIGATLGVFIAFILEFLDKTVKTEQEVQKLIGTPILGVIPITTEKDTTIKIKRV